MWQLQQCTLFPMIECICEETVVEWHIWWVTSVSSLRLGCSDWTRTLCFNMSHICSDLIPYFVQAIGVFGRVLRLKQIWGKRTDRITSFGCHIAFMFPWMRTFFFVCTLKRLSTFCYAHCCHIKCFSYKTIHEEYFPTRGARHITIFAPTIPHGWFFVHKNMYYFLIYCKLSYLI